MSAQDLREIANELRGEVLKMVHRAGAGHVAGPLSSADIIATLYLGGILKYDVNNPWWEERDRFVLSCGHYAPILYAALAKAGFFPINQLIEFGKLGSALGLHTERIIGGQSLAGIETSGGPLGQGVSVAVGMAMGIKLKFGERSQKETPKVYCLMSDGELQEGQVWEAFNLAVRRQLDNMIFVVDRNKIQIDKRVAEVNVSQIASKLEAFGLHVLEVDGHNGEKMRQVLIRAREVHGSPVVIVADTVAGKGVSLMEDKAEWHDRILSKEQLQMALQELEN